MSGYRHLQGQLGPDGQFYLQDARDPLAEWRDIDLITPQELIGALFDLDVMYPGCCIRPDFDPVTLRQELIRRLQTYSIYWLPAHQSEHPCCGRGFNISLHQVALARLYYLDCLLTYIAQNGYDHALQEFKTQLRLRLTALGRVEV